MLIFMLFRENMRNDGPMQSFIPKDDMLKEPTHTHDAATSQLKNYVLDETMNIWVLYSGTSWYILRVFDTIVFVWLFNIIHKQTKECKYCCEKNMSVITGRMNFFCEIVFRCKHAIHRVTHIPCPICLLKYYNSWSGKDYGSPCNCL